MNINRKIVSLEVLLMLATVGLSTPLAAQATVLSSEQAPGFYRTKLGKFEVVALSDGVTARRMDEILSDPQTVRAELSASHEPEPRLLSINSYLINTGTHVVLVDTGAGDLYGPTSGLLLKNLRAAGYRPDQIDVILLTHIHADHSGGLTVQGIRQFPRATVHVSERDVNLWFDKSEEAKAPPAKQITFEQSQKTVGPYLDAKQLIQFKLDTELVPGISTRSAPGHTPGHTAYLVESEGHRLLLWGDIIHSTEVQFGHPDVTVEYDVNPKQAIKTRRALLKSATKEGTLLGSAHIAFPGIGHVKRDGKGFQWVPLPYSAQVSELDPH